MLQVNYLAQVLLAHLLLPRLLASPAPRLLVVSSESHRFSLLDPAAPPSPALLQPRLATFHPVLQYNDTKLLLLLFSRAVEARLAGRGLTSLACHPGNLLPTRLHRHSLLHSALAALARPFTKSVEQAAASLVFALCGEAELLSQSGHVYINNCFPCKPSPAACSDSMARLVWEYTLTELETRLGPSWDKL